MFIRIDSRQLSHVARFLLFVAFFLDLILNWHVDLVNTFFVHNANKDQKVGIIIVYRKVTA